MATARRRRIVFVDECQFASNTLPTHEWANKYENMQFEKAKTQIEIVSRIKGVS
jgi:hypothetical protein